jgi:hypothetical protein
MVTGRANGSAPTRIVALFVAVVFACAAAQAGNAAPPPPCPAVQIADPTNDGHHGGTDVTAAWITEAGGRPQAVIQTRVGRWAPEHDDAEINGGGYALLFTAGGVTRYVRLWAPEVGPLEYDYGTYAPVGGFVRAGLTAGEVVHAPLNGTVTLDIPQAAGAVPGARLDDPFVLTYDGVTGGSPHWVDHGPGGTQPTDTARGADYVMGSCDPQNPPNTTVAVELRAPSSLKGGGRTATISGKVLPARGGIPVTITRDALRDAVSNVTSAADGTFAVTVPVRETTRVRAEAEGIQSQTLTITMRSTVTLAVRRLRSGIVRFTGQVRPILPGRVLLLRTDAIRPTASTRSLPGGRFTFRLRRVRPGGFQAVFIPSGRRAERSVSRTVRLRPPASARLRLPLAGRNAQSTVTGFQR